MSQTTLIRAIENFVYFGLAGLISVVPTLGLQDSWVAAIMAIIGLTLGALKASGVAPTSTASVVPPITPVNPSGPVSSSVTS